MFTFGWIVKINLKDMFKFWDNVKIMQDFWREKRENGKMT
jgi:hypothetical protein